MDATKQGFARTIGTPLIKPPFFCPSCDSSNRDGQTNLTSLKRAGIGGPKREVGRSSREVGLAGALSLRVRFLMSAKRNQTKRMKFRISPSVTDEGQRVGQPRTFTFGRTTSGQRLAAGSPATFTHPSAPGIVKVLQKQSFWPVPSVPRLFHRGRQAEPVPFQSCSRCS